MSCSDVYIYICVHMYVYIYRPSLKENIGMKVCSAGVESCSKASWLWSDARATTYISPKVASRHSFKPPEYAFLSRTQVDAWKLSDSSPTELRFLVCRVLEFIPLQEPLPRTLVKASRPRHLFHILTERQLHQTYSTTLRGDSLEPLHPARKSLVQKFQLSQQPVVLQLPQELCVLLGPPVGSRAIIPLNHSHIPPGLQFLPTLMRGLVTAWSTQDDELRALGNQQDASIRV